MYCIRDEERERGGREGGVCGCGDGKGMERGLKGAWRDEMRRRDGRAMCKRHAYSI